MHPSTNVLPGLIQNWNKDNSRIILLKNCKKLNTKKRILDIVQNVALSAGHTVYRSTSIYFFWSIDCFCFPGCLLSAMASYWHSKKFEVLL